MTENGWSSVVARNVAWVGVFASMLTILVSFIGCFAAQTGHRSILFCYVAAFTFILGCQIAAAVTMSNYANQLQITNPNAPSGSLTNYGDVNINNAVYSVYQKCCTGCPMPNVQQPDSTCNNTWVGSWQNATSPNCDPVLCGPTGSGVFVKGACASASSDVCYKFFPGDDNSVPPAIIDQSLCSALAQLTTNGKSIVGPMNNTVSCGGGSPKVFLANMSAYVRNALYGVAVVYIIVAFFEALILPAAIYVLCCVPRGGGLIKGEDEIEIV